MSKNTFQDKGYMVREFLKDCEDQQRDLDNNEYHLNNIIKYLKELYEEVGIEEHRQFMHNKYIGLDNPPESEDQNLSLKEKVDVIFGVIRDLTYKIGNESLLEIRKDIQKESERVREREEELFKEIGEFQDYKEKIFKEFKINKKEK